MLKPSSAPRGLSCGTSPDRQSGVSRSPPPRRESTATPKPTSWRLTSSQVGRGIVQNEKPWRIKDQKPKAKRWRICAQPPTTWMFPLPGAIENNGRRKTFHCFIPTWRNLHVELRQVKRTEWQVCAADPDSGEVSLMLESGEIKAAGHFSWFGDQFTRNGRTSLNFKSWKVGKPWEAKFEFQLRPGRLELAHFREDWWANRWGFQSRMTFGAGFCH